MITRPMFRFCTSNEKPAVNPVVEAEESVVLFVLPLLYVMSFPASEVWIPYEVPVWALTAWLVTSVPLFTTRFAPTLRPEIVVPVPE
jgi:hypothetical protein